MTASRYSIRHAQTPDEIAAFHALCVEYASSLPQIGLSLEVQGFEREMATLPGLYAVPKGAILLAWVGDEAVGCVAMRPMNDAGVCEMKRMFIRPSHRGQGLGHALASCIVEAARHAGHRTMRLDTDNNMAAAIAVYTALGFKPRERYNDDPCPCTLWFEVAL
ncbi:MAG: GNAT family N-acetyltransferase [Phycisphaerales bacterium]